MNRDWVMWLLSPLFPVAMGMPSSLVGTMLPMPERRVGADLDAAVCNPDMAVRFDEYSIESLRPPGPAVAREGRPRRALHAAKRAGGASLHRYPRLTAKIFNDGGHLRGHAHEVEAAVTRFIATNTTLGPQ